MIALNTNGSLLHMDEINLDELMEVARDGFLFDIPVNPSDIANTKNSVGDTLLHVAAARGCVREIEYLIKMGIKLNEQGDYGHTPLHCSAMTNQRMAYDYLIQRGADQTISDSEGCLASDYLENE